MKLHNRYRRAKKFKLDDDLEVMDEFSGRAKSHVKAGWDDYGSNGLWYKEPCIYRWLASRVGQSWSKVFSEYIRASKGRGRFVADFFRERIRGAVHRSVQLIDGDVYSLDERWRSQRYPLSQGDFYILNDTLYCIPRKRKIRYDRYRYNYVDPYRSKYEAAEKHVFGNKSFWQDNITYNRRVSPGVLEVVEHKVWRRNTTYPTVIWHHIPIMEYVEGKWTMVGSKVKSQRSTGVRCETASKKDIKKYNLV